MKSIYFIPIIFLFLVIPVSGIELRKLVPNSQYYKLVGVPKGIGGSYIRQELEARGIDNIFIGKTLIIVNAFCEACNKILGKVEFEDYKIIEGQEEHGWEHYKELYAGIDNIVFVNFNRKGVSLHFISEENEMIRYTFFREDKEFFDELFADIDAFLKLEDRLYKYPVSYLKMNIPTKKWLEVSANLRTLAENIRVISVSSEFVKVEFIVLEANRQSIIDMVENYG